MNKDDKAVALKEAEMLLIGAVIAIPDLYYEVDSMLSPEVFSSENNRVVWKAITDIVDCGDPVVTTSIARRIVGKALLAEGQTELSLVQSMVATFDDNYISGTFLERQKTIQGQAAELLSAQERRSIQNVLTQGQKKAQEPSLSNEALADWVETKVSECVKARIRSKAATEVFQESSRHVAFLADNPQLELGVTAKLNAWNRLVGPMAPGDLIVVGGATSMGKGQPLTSRVYTKDGHVLMGDIKVGTELASVDGRRSLVTGVYPQGERDVYEITFRDGRKVRCDDSHLWKVYNHRGGWRVLDTLELANRLSKKSNAGRFYVPMFHGDWGHDKELPVDPYVLGALLGDGGLTNGSIRISSADQFVLDKVLSRLGDGYSLSKCGDYDYRIVTPRGQTNGLVEALERLGLRGLKSPDKFIPDAYMTASRESRLALLQGLLDTDGHFCHTAEFSTSSERLAYQIVGIVQSLGGSCSMSTRVPTYTHNGERRNGLVNYRLRIRHAAPASLFSLPRHVERAKKASKGLDKLAIMSVELVGREPTQCIKVSHPDELYITDGFIVTHNTALVQQIAKEVMEKAQARGSDGGGVVVFSLEMTSVQWVNRYISQQTGIPTERLEVGPITMEEQEKVKRAAYDTRHDLMRLVDNGSLTVRHMLNEVKVQNRRKQVDLVVIDHLQFIEHPDPRKEGPAKTADITRQLKAMAKNIKAPVILISHLNRDIASRPNKRPQLSDLFGSSAIEKDADCVLFVHREHYWIQRAGPDWSPDPSEAEANRLKWEMALLREKDRAELILAKRRRGSGAGSCSLQFHADTTLFKD